MNPMEWSEKLANGLPAMDQTHQEFVERYNALVQALESGDTPRLLAEMDRFIAHTVEHFDQENRWMADIDFPACHRAEHDRVLVVLRDVRHNVEAGDLFLGRRLIEELAPWFENHANSMDAALAFYIGQIGYDVSTGTRPSQTPCTPETGAAGCVCSTTKAA